MVWGCFWVVLDGFGWFPDGCRWFRMAAEGFRWFRLVCCFTSYHAITTYCKHNHIIYILKNLSRQTVMFHTFQLKLMSHGILHYLWSKSFFHLVISIFLLSRYFFSIDFPQLKAWSYPTLLMLSFIDFKPDTQKSDTQIYKRTPMSKCDFNKVALQLSRVNLLHIFRTPFPRNTSGWLFLDTLYYSRDPDGQKFYSRQRIL